MVLWALMFAVVVVEYVCGKPWLPPLTMKDGCYLVNPEVEIFRVEGEAVIVSFPVFKSVLRVLNIASPTARFLITKDNETGGVAYESDGRVQQREKQLWLLPSQASDSGEYICTYRNDTYCITGKITLEVFESSSVDMEKVSYPISAMVGERLTFRCPSLSDFNSTDRLIEWYKENSSTAFQSGRAGSLRRDSANLMIPAVSCSHAGVYTCQLRVLIDQQQYKVSRVVLLRVQEPEPQISTTAPRVSVTSDPERNSTSSYNTDQASPPVIVSPLNGSIFESPHGSGLELFCKVLTRCHQADSTEVAWLVNGQSVESSYLDGRALQGGRRVTKVTEGCQIELRLFVGGITEEDVKTELKCVTQNQAGRQEVVAQLHLEDSTFTWLVVAAVAVSCFLSVVSVFLYVLFKPNRKRKLDYFLARQNSTF
ncbi:interleukin-1 receptor type 2 isoform X2 [Hippoglossus hippoglossus]|uniref:interleukin-1 receptor type 2 isoform X2 n=1 Tax=Hippoglossus hippoglossus TaxID=8267 RepID=UPI00148DCD87|nr:interleukin-1 receptor type 2 isoform X2 [Hippoglossus hippoglossus]